jgi:23S rRNA m2A2503 methyltransferase
MNENHVKQDILSLSQDELKQYLLSIGEPGYRAKQIFTWLHKGASFDQMTNIPASLRAKLTETAKIRTPKIARKLVSATDGTVKYLFELIDGERIESVFMKYAHGNTVCISSQAGCRMGCKFCASTINGKSRDLSPSEMLGQVIAVAADTNERVSGVVMMGIGEPLDNYDNVIKFLKLISAPDGICIGLRHISLSTCGLADKIRTLADESLPVTLSLSLHASDDVSRSEIMPINNKYNISAVLEACKYYFDKTGRRVSFEYTLISGKNDTPNHAANLAQILKTHRQSGAHVNLIPLNPIKENALAPPTQKSAQIFANHLSAQNINATIRRKLGADINASCGQLRGGER